MENETTLPKSFVQIWLPWIIGAGALLVYLLTLSRGVTFMGLPGLAAAGGWDWNFSIVAPLTFLAAYPVRWLPAAWQPAGMNFLAALFASLALALLARSVALLPHDRTRDQRAVERSDYSFLTIKLAWVPPLFAALVCGLQLTFWKHAVIGTGEALDLLVFAYVVRCLLEYRVEERDSWVLRMALVYGMGITNNYAMIAFFPALMVALVWIKKLSFFQVRFLIRFFLLLLAGLLLYLLLPALNSLSDFGDRSFFEYLKMNLGYQKDSVMRFPRYLALLVALTSVLPVTFMGIRWPASFGDISAVGNALTNLMTHVIHAVFLLACLYVAFDTPLSPQNLALKLTGRPHALLPIYFLGALSVGYFLGYFLLIFGAGPGRGWQPNPLKIWLFRLIFLLACAVALAVPVGLAVQNFPQLRADTTPLLSRFAAAAARLLPSKGAIVLSDDQYRLYALQNQLEMSGTRQNFILIDTTSLDKPAYHKHLRHSHGSRWPGQLDQRSLRSLIEAPTLVNLVTGLARSNEVYYLHPSFGYYFEYGYLKCKGVVFPYHLLPTNVVSPPPLTAGEIEENDAFWKKFRRDELAPVISWVKNRDPKKLQVNQMIYASRTYSRSANFFGVEAQKSGNLQLAREYFALALELNTNSPSAYANQEYNQQLAKGQRASAPMSDELKKRVALYPGGWNSIIGLNGPVDEPSACFSLADTFARGGNYRQAAQLLERVISLTPDNFGAHLGLAMMLSQAGMPDFSLAEVARIRAQTNLFTLDLPKEIALSQAEAWALVGKNEVNAAQKLLESLQERQPTLAEPFATLAEIYLVLGRSSNAMAVLEKQLKVQTTNVSALINYAVLKIGARDVEASIPYLDRALTYEPQNVIALLNRAIANLYTDKLEPARRDYESLERLLPKPSHLVYYGLGEIAWRQKRLKDAIKYYEEYLARAPLGTPEIKMINDRLEKLKSGSF